MSFEAMARSHVRELAREAFGLCELEVDDDGDLPFRWGSAMVYVSVVGAGRLCRVWSRAVVGVELRKPVLREICDANVSLVFARVCGVDRCVWVEAVLPLETLRPKDLRVMVGEVGRAADGIGTMITAVHGGRVALPEGAVLLEED